MKKLANILVKYRITFFVISVLLGLMCAFLIPQVTINKDQTKYLSKDSDMSKGLAIINSEFPAVELKDSYQIMFEGLTATEKVKIHNELQKFDGVVSVDYDINSTEYNSKTYTMYIVHTDYSNDNDKVSVVINNMKDAYSKDYNVYVYYSGAYLDVLDKLIPMATLIGLAILLLMCRSYFEPVILLMSIGIAVLINMGSNVIFESVSDMTFAIAAVFQLVLSIDYSIMLMHRFEQEYELLGKTDKISAMKNAIVNAVGSIASSSITTIVGLLVLLLMSFTIGRDIGLVISKGVFLSLVCVFTVMPTLIIWFYDLLCKLNKENLKQKILMRKGGKAND